MKKEKLIDFGVLTLRWYLIFYMISYGWSKLTLSQFGVHDPSILEQPIKDIDSFYVAWHLYGRSTFFNISTGILEIVGGILLIFNRTILIGALLVLSILAQILVIDIAFTTGIHGVRLPIRISGMILTDVLILYYYKEKILVAWKSLTNGITTKFKYKWFIYLILPIIGFLMDFLIAILTMPIKMLFDWLGK
ncbi:DoxX family membrane protein [Aquimarina litoralis]|uniref:DoxX family membrane protein n=1 Tax=Aquimarina litoralis TaxID=584605 RepID=UPI001C562EDC|nr:DoxX family membrane protein [Aquimarina litoralis]MBW1296287.1 DoxX family membrane protein [Aquimarina litoralis]